MKKLLIFIIIVGIAGVGLYYGLRGKNNLSQTVSDDVSPLTEPSEEEMPDDRLIEPDKIFTEPIVYNSLKNSYSGTGFSFKYSDGFKVPSAPVETGPAPSGVEGEIVTIENNKGSGFQIFITPFDEPFDGAQGRPGALG